ncbi:unnamed protein product, partial [Trichogramma brassicae]
DILERLATANYISCVDLRSGFYQIAMDPNSAHKTGFAGPNGTYEYKRMPMGIKSAPAQLYELADEQELKDNTLPSEKDHPPGRFLTTRAKRIINDESEIIKKQFDDGSDDGSDILRQPRHKKTNRNVSPPPVRTNSNTHIVEKEPSIRRAKLKAKEKIAKIITDGRRSRKQTTQITREQAAGISKSKHHDRQVTQPYSLTPHTAHEHAADDINLQQTQINESENTAHISDTLHKRLPETRDTSPCSVCTSSDDDMGEKKPLVRQAKLKAIKKISEIICYGKRHCRQPAHAEHEPAIMEQRDPQTTQSREQPTLASQAELLTHIPEPNENNIEAASARCFFPSHFIFASRTLRSAARPWRRGGRLLHGHDFDYNSSSYTQHQRPFRHRASSSASRSLNFVGNSNISCRRSSRRRRRSTSTQQKRSRNATVTQQQQPDGTSVPGQHRRLHLRGVASVCATLAADEALQVYACTAGLARPNIEYLNGLLCAFFLASKQYSSLEDCGCISLPVETRLYFSSYAVFGVIFPGRFSLVSPFWSSAVPFDCDMTPADALPAAAQGDSADPASAHIMDSAVPAVATVSNTAAPTLIDLINTHCINQQPMSCSRVTLQVNSLQSPTPDEVSLASSYRGFAAGPQGGLCQPQQTSQILPPLASFDPLEGRNGPPSQADDILIASPDVETHRKHVEIVFERLRKAALQLNLSKCVFESDQVEFLGFLIDRNGYKPLPVKVEKINNFPRPQTVEQLRRFLGMINFYHHCMPGSAQLQIELNGLLTSQKKGDKTPINWNSKAIESFEQLKRNLAFPQDGAPLRVCTDASDSAMGAVLEQQTTDQWKPLAFFSRKFDRAQRGYSTFDRELTAIVGAVKHFMHYLEGVAFVVCTDHKPLLSILTQPLDTTLARRRRQVEFLSMFDMTLEYLPGPENAVADALSRLVEAEPHSLSDSEPADPSACIGAISLPLKLPLNELTAAQANDDELRGLLKDPAPPFKLCKVVWQPSNQQIFAEVSAERIRPYVPGPLRFKVFDIFHGLAHPGPRITDKLIRKFYIWPSMSRDITLYCKACMPCQQSKVTRHNRPQPMHFDAPDARFQHVHIDLVGPLPECRGFSYLLTMIDRFSRWPEAVPLQDITAETVARAFVKHWVSRFSSPSILTTDQGSQFESKLFEEVSRALGIEKIHTTPYHPQANGMIERFHRDIKAAFMCRSDAGDWLDALPTIMLGLRTRPILDTDLSPAEMLYGRALRIPGIFCEYDDDDYDSRAFKETFLRHMISLKPLPVKHKDASRPFYYADLDTCSHELKIIKCGKRSLERPYTGPHRVISRDPSKRHMEIQVDDRIVRVSVDQLKPAHFLDEALAHQAEASVAPGAGVAASNPVPPASARAPVSSASIDIPGPSSAVMAPPIARNNEQTSDQTLTNNNPIDVDDALLPDYPELTRNPRDELGIGHSVTVGEAADVPFPPEQSSFTSEHSYASTSQANGKRKARSNNKQPSKRGKMVSHRPLNSSFSES